jgi:protease-4
MSNDRSFLMRAWLGFWGVINGTRKLVLNLLFLVFLVIIVQLVLTAGEAVEIRTTTTLVLQPRGEVVEQFTGSPADQALEQALGRDRLETRLRDMLQAIEHATDDDRITQMVIDPGYMWGIGLASLKELELAVGRFRASGKNVISVVNNLDQQQYYLAALADEIWLSPNGMVWIDGYANYRQYYRQGLDKLEVEVNLFRAGEYKTAMEPFVRDDMSPEAKEANLFWIGSLWQQYLEGISLQRGIPLEALSTAINQFSNRLQAVDGDFARFAMELGLVDRFVSRPQARRELAELGAANDRGDSFRQIGFEDYLGVTDPDTFRKSKSRVAVVVAEGEIARGKQPPGRVGADSTTRELRRAARDETVKALVLRINSPGGEVFASEQIRLELQAIRDAGKTVVVSMGDVAASGGYWIAMASDEVWASPATITGSIGVFGMIPTFADTLGKIGIHSDGVGTTPLAGKLRLDRPLDQDLGLIFQASVERTYQNFLSMVADARSSTVEEIDKVARGRVWSGVQAKELNLVDRMGTVQEAIESAARISGLKDGYEVFWMEPEISGLERFLLDMTASAVAKFGAVSVTPSNRMSGFVESLLEDVLFLASSDRQLTIAAHCLCGVD